MKPIEVEVDADTAISIADKFIEALAEHTINKGTLYFGLYHIIANVISTREDKSLWDAMGDVYIKFMQDNRTGVNSELGH